jgi:hypothetical protein
MRTQILLIALLVWGPVGSAVCEASCAQASAAAYADAEEPANVPPCHGGGSPAPGSTPQESDCSGAICSCADYERASMAAMPPRAPGFVDFAALLPVEIHSPRTARSAIPLADPPERPLSPYLYQNPPLLI